MIEGAINMFFKKKKPKPGFSSVQTKISYLSRSELKKILRAMAILDIIVMDRSESWLRLVNCCENQENQVITVLLDNGGGDTLSVFMSRKSVLIKGFDHEDSLNQYGAEEWDKDFIAHVYRDMPEEYEFLLEEEELKNEVTFCIWNQGESHEWEQNVDPRSDGGKEYLLGYLAKSAQEWLEWAGDYYELTLSEEIAEAIYGGLKVTEQMIAKMNPNRKISEAMEEIQMVERLFES